jgi:lysozyme
MINQASKNLIAQYEGLRLSPYLCPAGIPTIGIGSTEYADGTKVKLSDKPITDIEAWKLFYDTLKQYEFTVTKAVHIPLTENQYGALVSFTYNVGIGSFKSSTLLRKINDGDHNISVEFLKWNKVNHKEVLGLTKRRQAEWELFNEYR